jgi:actin-related protein 8
LLLAPWALFNAEVFGQDKRGKGQANALSDPEDPHDANYLRETSRRAHKEALDQNASAALDATDAASAAAQGDDRGANANEYDLVVDSLAAEATPDDQLQQQLLYSLDSVRGNSMEFI